MIDEARHEVEEEYTIRPMESLRNKLWLIKDKRRREAIRLSQGEDDVPF